MHVLLVEDTFQRLHSLVDAFRAVGDEVFPAPDQSVAFSLAKALGHRLDLIVSDLLVPDGICVELPASTSRRPTIEKMVVELRHKGANTPIYVYSSDPESSDLRYLAESYGCIRVPSQYVPPDAKRANRLAEWVHQHRRSKQPRTAFIVHGHDHGTRDELRELLLNQMGFSRVAILENEPNRLQTIIEKFQATIINSEFIFVLLTPDDHLVNQASRREEWRARQNVVLELGFAMALKGRPSGRVIVLRDERVEEFTDFHGIVWVPLKNGIKGAASSIKRELVAAGCALP